MAVMNGSSIDGNIASIGGGANVNTFSKLVMTVSSSIDGNIASTGGGV